MASSSRLQPLLRPPKPENPRNPCNTGDTEDRDQFRSVQPAPIPADPFRTPLLVDGLEEDSALARSEFLTREEVLRRRSRRLKQLVRYYRDQYWALMEEARVWYREYYWLYGKSPFMEDQEEGCNGERRGHGENPPGEKNRMGIGFESSTGRNETKGCFSQRKCAFPGCKAKAMALTNCCHPHILSDTKQRLYKPCIAPVGQVACGKPILRAAVPSLCNGHLQKYQKNVHRAFKRGGLNIASSSKAPRFSSVIAEFVRQIQAKRWEARDKTVKNDSVKKETGV